MDKHIAYYSKKIDQWQSTHPAKERSEHRFNRLMTFKKQIIRKQRVAAE